MNVLDSRIKKSVIQKIGNQKLYFINYNRKLCQLVLVIIILRKFYYVPTRNRRVGSVVTRTLMYISTSYHTKASSFRSTSIPFLLMNWTHAAIPGQYSHMALSLFFFIFYLKQGFYISISYSFNLSITLTKYLLSDIFLHLTF